MVLDVWGFGEGDGCGGAGAHGEDDGGDEGVGSSCLAEFEEVVPV